MDLPFFAALGFSLLTAAIQAPTHEPPTRIQVAEGVYVFVTPPYGEMGFDGN